MAPRPSDITVSLLPVGYGCVVGRVLSDTGYPRWMLLAIDEDLPTARARAARMAKEAQSRAWLCRDTTTFEEIREA